MNARKVYVQGQLREGAHTGSLARLKEDQGGASGPTRGLSLRSSSSFVRGLSSSHSLQGDTSPAAPYPWRGAGEAAEQKRRVTRPLTFGGWAPHLLSLLAERAQDPPSSARAGATAPGAQDSTPGREVTGPGHSPLGGHRARGVPSFGDSASRAAQGLTC